MTVSRTINGHPYVAQETAKKVQAAIRLLDYRPNYAARMLTGQLSRSIALIVPDIADTFFSVIIHAVQQTAHESGYLVWLAASNGDPSVEAAQVEIMVHHPVDGILLVPVDSRNKYLKTLADGNNPGRHYRSANRNRYDGFCRRRKPNRGAIGSGASHPARIQEDQMRGGKPASVDHQTTHDRIQGIDETCEAPMPKRSAIVRLLFREIHFVGLICLAQSS